MPRSLPPPPEAPTGPDWRAPRASLARSGAVARELERLEDKVLEGRRITPDEGLWLHEHADVLSLGRMADGVRARLHPERRVTYIVDRNVNPTNVCITDCGFCAFYRRPGAEGAYVQERAELHARVAELDAQGGRQLLMQGGHHPYLKTDWWCDLLADLRARWPHINAHALSAPELDHLAKLDKRPLEEVLRDLIEAGLGSVPGAGAEVLVERVRRIIAPKKTSTERWLEVHRRVHEAGLRSSATLMFGHVETAAERIEHLERLRALQDETGGFTAFACWTMQPEGVPEAELYPAVATPGVYLRVQALSRIYLDNFENIQTSYVTQGLKMAQITLLYGCNDFGGTMLEENVVSAAGCFHLAPIERIERVIERAGFAPARRNSWYGLVDERHPELGPRDREAASTHHAAPERVGGGA
ncbi:MAG TPA: cyclic dehypoxanthinyl futalosine synthase [Planctomycetota bacterium]|nr:cyclic dehypoxanthinyl futalosine synthase [Planctomycetota bacterium]